MVIRRIFFLFSLLLLNACDEGDSSVKSSFVVQDGCPKYFSSVSENLELGTPAFCISQDLMAVNSHSELIVRRDNLAALIVNHGDAEAACQSLGANYDLVSMKEYQTAARELE